MVLLGILGAISHSLVHLDLHTQRNVLPETGIHIEENKLIIIRLCWKKFYIHGMPLKLNHVQSMHKTKLN